MTGHVVGGLLRALELPLELLDHGVECIIRDWPFQRHARQRGDEAFKQDVLNAFAGNGVTHSASRLMMSLRDYMKEEAEGFIPIEDSSDSDYDSYDGFEELPNSQLIMVRTAEPSNTDQQIEEPSSDNMIIDIEEMLKIDPDDVLYTESAHFGGNQRLVDYSDSSDEDEDEDLIMTDVREVRGVRR